uniref:Ig-like domain-containing protein n=1 Tax=Glossina pallidipes TaxID=7398 RepID=A0A1A9ZD95_GLOPL
MVFAAYLASLSALLLLRTFSIACPAEVCVCKWKGGKQTVECGAQSLPNIPEGMDPGTQVLNFSGNALQVLQSERFLRMDLLNLQKIYLSRNQLIRIHEKAFRGLTNLVELDLSENALQQIPTETFQDYSSLMRLSLSGNPIRELKLAAFRYLSFLTTLELSNCQIERVENEAFIGMDNLEWLRLDGNRISYIQGNHILPKSLHGISLQSNRWTCDCRLLDVHAWLTTYNTPQSEDPKCVEPTRLKSQVIKSLKREEFACLPEVTPQSTYNEVSEGRNLSISCVVRAIPEPKVMWLFNGQVMSNDSLLDNPHLYYYVDDSAGISEEKRSEIFIYNVGIEDNGTFSCVGQNIAGTTFSNYTIRVIIKEPPIVNEVSFPQNYLNYIVASSAGGGIIFAVLLCTVIIKCKQRDAPRKRKKCNPSAVTSVNGNNTTSSDGGSSNDTGLMKCSSIINDGDSINAGSGLILSACDSMTPTKLGKENGVILGNQMKQNIMLYAPLEGSNQTLQLSVNIANAATPPPTLPASLMVNPAISNTLAYCSPPASLRNAYAEKNPDLINDTENGVKHKLKTSTSLDATATAYDVGNDCSAPVQYDRFYQLAPHFGSQIMRPNTSSGNSRFGAMTTLPRGMQLKTVMNSLPAHAIDVHLNPVCFLGQDGFAYDFNNKHLQQIPPAHHHLIQQQQASSPQQQHSQQHTQSQQNFYRTLPHNRVHKQQQQQQYAASAANGMRYSLEAEFLQQHSSNTPSYDKLTMPNVRFTAEGYPQQTQQLGQYPSPPEGYKSANSPTNALNDNAVTKSLQQWPPCLPGYHAQSGSIRYPTLITGAGNLPLSPQQLESVANTTAGVNIQTLNSGTLSSESSPIQTSLSLSQQQTQSKTNAAMPTAQTITKATATTTTINASTQSEGRKPMRCAAAQADSTTIPECDETDISPTSASNVTIVALKSADDDVLTNATTATPTEHTTKTRHLNGPLADSPDEGYVGDSHENSDI